MNINFEEKFIADESAIVIGVPKNIKELKHFDELDTLLNGLTEKIISANVLSDTFGKITTTGVTIQREYRKVIAVGLGEIEELSALKIQRAIGKLFQFMESQKDSKAQFLLHTFAFDEAEVANAVGLMAAISNHKLAGYDTADKKQFHDELSVTLVTKTDVSESFQNGDQLGSSIALARDYATMPPNLLYPESFANDLAVQFKERPFVKGAVKDFEMLTEEGFGLLIAVGKASARKPRLVTIEYKHPDASDEQPVVLVGKGITYDTGGYSLKPGRSMQSMKYDMSGAANVVGMIDAVSRLQLPVHVVAVLALAENMVDGNGMRPDDVYKSLSGKTVEVSNTDAEGRLVLADAVYYAAKTYNPKVMMDFATLTGAVIQAIGAERTGVFTNQEQSYLNNLLISSKVTGEDIWQLPISELEEEAVKKSDIADLINADFKPGGASFAAGFIKQFVGDTPWIHFDIAGTSNTSSNTPFAKKGSTGVMIRTIVDLIKSGTLYE